MSKKALKLKKCKARDCEEMFAPRNMQHQTHHYLCAMAYTKELKEKRAAKDKRKAVKEFKQNDKSELVKVAQQVFNKFIRLRDKNEACISCGNKTRQFHAGHFMPVGSNGHIRFDENNCHKQCSICNNHKSGNLTEYEPKLVQKIGQEEVDRLKIKFTRSYDVEELKEIIDTYKSKIRDLDE